MWKRKNEYEETEIERLRNLIKSYRNFYYDLSKSPNVATIKGVKFFFPSAYRLDIFTNKYAIMKEKMAAVLIDKVTVCVNVELLAAFTAYSVIQPAQQYVILEDGSVIKCLNSLEFDGLRPSLKSLDEM